jgi:hypothetical protein
MIMNITITDCYAHQMVRKSAHRTTQKETAIERAIRKHWGASAELHIDRGLSNDGLIYGQIGRPAKTGGLNMITGRISIEWE